MRAKKESPRTSCDKEFPKPYFSSLSSQLALNMVSGRLHLAG